MLRMMERKPMKNNKKPTVSQAAFFILFDLWKRNSKICPLRYDTLQSYDLRLIRKGAKMDLRRFFLHRSLSI
jgi:hypothetical protein